MKKVPGRIWFSIMDIATGNHEIPEVSCIFLNISKKRTDLQRIPGPRTAGIGGGELFLYSDIDLGSENGIG